MPTLLGTCLRLVGLLLLLHTVLLVQADIEQQQPTWLIRYKSWYKQHTLAMLQLFQTPTFGALHAQAAAERSRGSQP